MADSQFQCRLIHHPPAGGAWNMAVDEALCEPAEPGGPLALRFYGWLEPTLSLGYFQTVQQRAEHAASRDCPLVRRASGGGAILHDREITYSLVIPAGHRFTRDAPGLYSLVHDALIQSLSELGIEGAALATTAPAPAPVPFLCFARRTAFDVLLRGAKIAGSAQRRHRGAILQHGSVLLERSPMAPELPGLNDLPPVRCDEQRLLTAWQRELATALGVVFTPDELRSDEKERAELLTREKYGADAWNRRR